MRFTGVGGYAGCFTPLSTPLGKQGCKGTRPTLSQVSACSQRAGSHRYKKTTVRLTSRCISSMPTKNKHTKHLRNISVPKCTMRGVSYISKDRRQSIERFWYCNYSFELGGRSENFHRVEQYQQAFFQRILSECTHSSNYQNHRGDARTHADHISSVETFLNRFARNT